LNRDHRPRGKARVLVLKSDTDKGEKHEKEGDRDRVRCHRRVPRVILESLGLPKREKKVKGRKNRIGGHFTTRRGNRGNYTRNEHTAHKGIRGRGGIPQQKKKKHPPQCGSCSREGGRDMATLAGEGYRRWWTSRCNCKANRKKRAQEEEARGLMTENYLSPEATGLSRAEGRVHARTRQGGDDRQEGLKLSFKVPGGGCAEIRPSRSGDIYVMPIRTDHIGRGRGGQSARIKVKNFTVVGGKRDRANKNVPPSSLQPTTDLVALERGGDNNGASLEKRLLVDLTSTLARGRLEEDTYWIYPWSGRECGKKRS